MVEALPHPVIALLGKLRRKCAKLESKIRRMNRKARRPPIDYSDYTSVRQERVILAEEVRQMKRKVRRTHFHSLGYSVEIHSILRTVIVRENKIDEQIQQTCKNLDRALIKLQLIRAKIKQLEAEIKRRRIGQKQRLVYSTVLRPGPTTGEPTGFSDLAAELRNYIYDLSGCLRCQKCPNFWASFDLFSSSRCLNHGRRPFPMYVPCTYVDSDVTEPRADFDSSTFDSKTMEQERLNPERDIRYLLPRTWDEPVLLRVSRQVRSDTVPMFFGTLPVSVWADEMAWERMLKWLKTIGKEKAGMLRDIEIVRLRSKSLHELPFVKKRCSPSDALFGELDELGVRVEVKGLLHWKSDPLKARG